jgi:hypothetical protein
MATRRNGKPPDRSSADPPKKGCQPRQNRGPARNQVALEIADDGIWDEAVIRGLLDDWLVPMIVDRIIDDMGHR